MAAKQQKPTLKPTWKAVLNVEWRAGDAILTIDDVVIVTGYSREFLFRELEHGEMAGRFVGGPHSWVTTWQSVLAWARDDQGTARRRGGDLPKQIASTREAAKRRHAEGKAAGLRPGFHPLRAAGGSSP